MNKHIFSVEPRTITGRKVKNLRAQGLVPASIFGKNVPSQNIQVDAKNFKKLLQDVGESALIYLSLAKTELPVLVREIVVHPVTGQILHVSFNQVNLKEKVSASVPLILEGESPADRDKLGILVQQLDAIEVEALPTDIPEGLTVDISVLSEVSAAIYVKDLAVDSSKLTITSDPESIIAKIEPLAAEEVVEAPVADAEAPADTNAPAAETPEASSESAE